MDTNEIEKRVEELYKLMTPESIASLSEEQLENLEELLDELEALLEE